MINQLQELITQFTQKEVATNNNVNNNLAGDVAAETGNSIMDGLKSAVSNGNITELLSLASNHTDVNALTSNPVVQNIIQSLTSRLSSNLNIESATSSGLAGSIVPQILSAVLNRAKEGKFNLTDLLSSLNGGSGNILDQNGDGKVDFKDAVSAFQNGTFKDLLGGFFKK